MNMNKNQQKPVRQSKGSPERGTHSSIALSKNKDRKISKKQPNPTSKKTRGTTDKAQST